MSEKNFIVPTITEKGFRNAVKDYDRPSVIEELAANSYDEDASTVIVLLNSRMNELYILDDRDGFSREKIEIAATLGGGDKSSGPFSIKKRHYLGSYGVGLKSTLNIASSITIDSYSKEGRFIGEVNWEELKRKIDAKEGFPYKFTPKAKGTGNGATVKLKLKSPTDKGDLDKFGRVLSNLPNDNSNFLCYYGIYEEVAPEIEFYWKTFLGLKQLAKKLEKAGKLSLATNLTEKDLEECEVSTINDAENKSKAIIYFAGMDGDKSRHLKKSLRGKYVRIHGRLLKHNFSENKYTYNISRHMKFAAGLRVELQIDWLRDQITLSRDGLQFANEFLENQFTKLLQKAVSAFIQPKLKQIQKRKENGEDKILNTRLARVDQRIKKDKGVLIKGLKTGYRYIPETDAEMAILLASQPTLLQRIGKYELVDYNDQGSFDCIFYDQTREERVQVELEPTLEAFLGHNISKGIELIVTWRRGNWKPETRKKGKSGLLKLVADKDKRSGFYKLLEYSSDKSESPKNTYPVVVLEETF
jgi:hypothetical protein